MLVTQHLIDDNENHCSGWKNHLKLHSRQRLRERERKSAAYSRSFSHFSIHSPLHPHKRIYWTEKIFTHLWAKWNRSFVIFVIRWMMCVYNNVCESMSSVFRVFRIAGFVNMKNSSAIYSWEQATNILLWTGIYECDVISFVLIKHLLFSLCVCFCNHITESSTWKAKKSLTM